MCFSTGMPQKDESIFASADIFKDTTANVDNTMADTSSNLYSMPWIDSNDSLGALMSAVPKDVANVTQGVQTYGIWEGFLYLDSSAYDFWMFLGNQCGLGLGLGLVGATVLTKLMFAPTVLYGVSQSQLTVTATDGHQNEASST